jgi:hypothetical protein
MQPTRLFTDYQAGRVTGFRGGWDNARKLGVTFDTRDFEPDPASGVMLQAVGRVSSEVLGSRDPRVAALPERLLDLQRVRLGGDASAPQNVRVSAPSPGTAQRRRCSSSQ